MYSFHVMSFHFIRFLSIYSLIFVFIFIDLFIYCVIIYLFSLYSSFGRSFISYTLLLAY